MRAAFEAEGITVVTDARLTAARREGNDGPVTATLVDGRSFTADEILVAVGRRPSTRDIGLDTVGLRTRWLCRGGRHSARSRVDGGWLYACGDVNGRALLTHMGKYQAGSPVTSSWARMRATRPARLSYLG